MLLHEASRDEQRYRLAGRRDSLELERLVGRFASVRATIPIPPPAGPGSRAERIRFDVVRTVGLAELAAARLALEGHRPADCVERAEWVFGTAGQDTFLQREADLRVIDALQALRRYDDALARMHATLRRYRPVPPRTLREEDPILRMPELIVALRRELGDSAGAREEVRLSIRYFEGIRATSPPPLLEAQVLVQEVRAYLELGDRRGALAALERLEALTRLHPDLESGRPEVLFSRGRVESMRGGDYRQAIATYDEIVERYPSSPFAARALLETGVLLEGPEQRREALKRYGRVLESYGSEEATASIALFRQAMIRDQLGDWPGAKQDLERLPVRYPRTRGALEAPFAIVEHYARGGEMLAMRLALLRAVESYRSMVATDSTSVHAADARWNMARCYAGLERWEDALHEIDGMAARHRGLAITANAILEAARISERLGQKARAAAYLQRFLADYPRSPFAARARAKLDSGTLG
jgi:tetratricopeptide (TPR) repeat protein